jgi:ligand-binding sensor domain-containing protein
MRIGCYIGVCVIIIASLFGCKQNPTSTEKIGPQWITFLKDSTTNILNDNIHDIFIAQSRHILFGTDQGVVEYRYGRWEYLPPDSFSYPVNTVLGVVFWQKVCSISQASDGSFWFGLGTGGIQRYNPFSSVIQWQRYNRDNTPILQYNRINNMASSVGDRGSFWIATNLGAYEYIFPGPPALPTNGHFEQAPSISGVQSSDCYVSVSPVNGNLYFGSIMDISYYDITNDRWHVRHLRSKFDSPIRALEIDYYSTIWVGKLSGVTSFNPEQDTMYDYTPNNTSGKLPMSSVNAVATDFFYKTRWFGTNSGLAQLEDTTWTLFNTTNTPALPSDKIQALAYDLIKHNLWIGTDKGIVVYNPNGTRL